MTMLREFCTDPTHLIHPATALKDGRQLCPACTGERITERNVIGTPAKEME